MPIFNVTSITKFHFVCNRCATEVVFPTTTDLVHEPSKCPGCQTQFLNYTLGNPPEEAKAAAELLSAIQELQNIVEGMADFEVRLEVPSDA